MNWIVDSALTLTLPEGNSDLQGLEAVANAIISWKKDLTRADYGLNLDEALMVLQQATNEMPSSTDFGVATYIVMASEILLRDDKPETVQRSATDLKNINGFMTSALKIQKKHIPAVVQSAIDKATKDVGLTNKHHSRVAVDSPVVHRESSNEVFMTQD